MILKKMQKLCSLQKIKWSTHAAARMQERGINRLDVLNCLKKGEIIENYPDDFPHPSCLIFGYTLNNEVIHTVAGWDEEYVYIITAYYPNVEKFSTDLKKRKEQ